MPRVGTACSICGRIRGQSGELERRDSEPHKVDQQDHGHTAEHVVIATDGYTSGLLPELDRTIKPVRGQVIVTEPLAETLYPRPHYARHGFEELGVIQAGSSPPMWPMRRSPRR